MNSLRRFKQKRRAAERKRQRPEFDHMKCTARIAMRMHLAAVGLERHERRHAEMEDFIRSARRA